MFYALGVESRLSPDCLQTCNTWENVPSCFQTHRWSKFLQDLQKLCVKENLLERILEKLPGLAEMKETSGVGVISCGRIPIQYPSELENVGGSDCSGGDLLFQG